eukprot:TRINITY_DN2363_c0_g4_i2.p1 TRINITY_DN2363_c0_g4~~TRINITY_DN2363_c0_g4_i2.p1  ORF type:complete len:1051 (-),score=173.49 TRINITY_DN2363_c0_g4_i2:203-3355(-)
MYSEIALHNEVESCPSERRPVRVLVICSQPLLYSDQSEGQLPVDLLNIQEERNRISSGAKKASSATEIHFLQEATPQNVREALKENWDVIHVSAHGIKGGIVFFEDGYASSHPLTSSEFSDLFCAPLSSKHNRTSNYEANEDKKLVIFLSCCYSHELGKVLFRGLKNFLSEENFNIITIKGSMNEDAGLLFAENFYYHLFTEGVVSTAFNFAQSAVETSPTVGDALHIPLDTFNDDDDFEDSSDSYDSMDLIDSGSSSDRQINSLPWSKRFTLISEASNFMTLELAARESTLCQERLLGSTVCHSNIPLQPSNSILGRSKDIASIVHLFEHRKVNKVGLTGPIGVGKTECSKALAAWFKERGKVSRIIYTTAHESGKLNRTYFTEALELFQVIHSCVNSGSQSSQGLEEQTKSVHQFLELNRSLIIIDSFDLLQPEVRKRVYNYINSLPPATLFVFTSTEILSMPEVFNHQVERLNIQDSRKLFWNVMKVSGYLHGKETLPSSDVSAFKDIVESLDGFPQALISVASKTATMSLQEIHSSLGTDPTYLFVEREPTGQNVGIWNTFIPLYNKLSEPERNLFIYLCAFPGVVTTELISFVFSNGASISETLQLLINRSILKQESNRVHIYTPLRKFGLKQLESPTQSYLLKRGIDFHLLYLQNICLRHLRIQSGLETKNEKEMAVLTSFSCMMNVIQHLLEMSPTGETFSVHVHRFLNQIDILFDEIILSRNWEQGAKLAQGLIDLADRASLPHLKMRALRFQASIFCHQTDEQCVITENFDNDSSGLVSTPPSSSSLSPLRANILELATQHVSESIHLASTFHEVEEMICSMITKAHLELVNGQLESAKDTLRGCLLLCQDKQARKELIASSLSLLARLSRLEGNLSKSRRIHSEIAELIQMHFSDLQPSVQHLLMANPGDSAEQRESEVIWVCHRLRRGHVLAVWNRFELGHLSRSGGDDSSAKTCFKDGLELSYKVDSPYLTCLMLFSLGSAMLSLHGDRNDQILGDDLQEEEEAAALLQAALKISLDIRADDLHTEIKSQMSLIDFQF